MARARWKIAEMNRYGLSSNCTQTAFIYAVRSNRNKNQSESEKAPQKSQGAAVATLSGGCNVWKQAPRR